MTLCGLPRSFPNCDPAHAHETHGVSCLGSRSSYVSRSPIRCSDTSADWSTPSGEADTPRVRGARNRNDWPSIEIRSA